MAYYGKGLKLIQGRKDIVTAIRESSIELYRFIRIFLPLERNGETTARQARLKSDDSRIAAIFILRLLIYHCKQHCIDLVDTPVEISSRIKGIKQGFYFFMSSITARSRESCRIS